MSTLENANPAVQKTLSKWSELPDIEKVTDRLSVEGEKFLEGVGRTLFDWRQTSRFAVTLLHSHFEVYADEALVESLDYERRYLITSIRPLKEVMGSQEFVPKSWKFNVDAPESRTERIEILTWGSRTSIPQAPLSNDDEPLVHSLADIFREHKVCDRFGMALVGPLADTDKIWTEGTDFLGRRLIQEQFPIREVEARNPIKTMWVFGEDGKFLITLLCCLRTRDGSGHTGRVHPPGGDLAE
jgi:hypothetical protein